MTPLEARAAWVEALRSGEYQQGVGRLAMGGRHCCLGVACEVAIKEGIIDRYDPEAFGLPIPVAEWLGFGDNYNAADPRLDETVGNTVYRSLSALNDLAHWDFDKIADIIESERFANDRLNA